MLLRLLLLRTHLRLLERILHLIILPYNNLLLLLRRNMLNPDLLRHAGQKLANETGVPEFGRDAQVLAAPHQGVGFAAFGCRWDAVRVEVLLFAAGYGDETIGGGQIANGGKRKEEGKWGMGMGWWEEGGEREKG